MWQLDGMDLSEGAQSQIPSSKLQNVKNKKTFQFLYKTFCDGKYANIAQIHI